MKDSDKICCWLSWNLFLRMGAFLLVLGIPFGIYKFQQITLYQLFSGFGALIGFYLFYKRNSVFEKQLIQKDEQYVKENQFKSFLDSTKLLTDKDSTVEAKISALYLLYDTTKQHNDNVSRVIQVINKQLVLLINCLENRYGEQTRTKKLISTKRYLFQHKIENKYTYTYNDSLSIDINDRKLKRTIKEWQYNGNDAKKLTSVSLSIIKKIFLDVSQNNNELDLSNTVLFDLDTDYDKEIKISKSKKPIENIVFLECKLHNVDFSNVIYHQVSFIKCDLKDCNFAGANLWGALFENCILKNVKFNNAECEGVEFKNCRNLTSEQLEKMKFKNKIDGKKYLIICNQDIDKVPQSKYFSSLDEFDSWKSKND